MGWSAGRTLAAIGTWGQSEYLGKAGSEAVKGVDSATGAAAARDKASREQEEQTRLLTAQEEERKRRKLQEESDAATGAARAQARARQKQAAAAAFGRSDTLVTGPLGLPGNQSLVSPGAPGKTLLGT